MSKKVTKLSVLRNRFQNSSEIGEISLREFIENESLKEDFWEWFFNIEIKLPLSDDQQKTFQTFLKLVDRIEKRTPKVKNKDTDCHIKLSISDKEIIQNKAKKLGLTLSSYVRKSAVGNKIIIKTDMEAVRQIRKIGVNINQIAHKINQEPSSKNINIGLANLENYMVELGKIIANIEK